jgi:hypothetical protein
MRPGAARTTKSIYDLVLWRWFSNVPRPETEVNTGASA